MTPIKGRMVRDTGLLDEGRPVILELVEDDGGTLIMYPKGLRQKRSLTVAALWDQMRAETPVRRKSGKDVLMDVWDLERLCMTDGVVDVETRAKTFEFLKRLYAEKEQEEPCPDM